MRILKVYLHGSTMGTPPKRNDHLRTVRGEVGGWSRGSTRRNVAFLRSVVPDSLLIDSEGQTLYGYAFTLTLRECPLTSTEWHRMRTMYFKRLARAGMTRAHWVVEWQRRGVPHLHGCIWSPHKNFNVAVIQDWLQIAAPYGAGPKGQHQRPIHDAIGWFKYLAKHAARGVSHYQRSPENVPKGWKKTGRVWGYLGDWDRRDSMQLTIEDSTFYRLRRYVRAWRIADSRASGDSFRIRSARAMLSCPDRALSAIRGISEWIDQDTMLLLLDAARGTDEVTC